MDAAIMTAGLTASRTASPSKAAGGAEGLVQARARKAAEDFEAVFLSTLLDGMFANLKTGIPGGGGKSEKMYRSMMVGEYAKEISANGGLGIADHVYREILAVQETYQK